MNALALLSTASQWLQQLARRWRQARDARRALEQLSAMSEYELRDIGISHASIAAEARFVNAAY